jgi:hypothetical protein
MRRRIEVRETIIAPGAIVRLKKEASPRLSLRLARWEVLAVDGEFVSVRDTEDPEDVRTFETEHLERVSGGESAVVGYTFVDEEDSLSEGASEDEQYVDDPYDDVDEEVEVPSLFDDPIALQLEEDKDDPDYEDGAEAE